jgi:hypothetical protein
LKSIQLLKQSMNKFLTFRGTQVAIVCSKIMPLDPILNHINPIHMFTYFSNIYFNIFFQLASTVLIGPWLSLMDFSIHRHLVGLLGWGISPTQDLYRNTGQHNTETRRHTYMPRAGFETAIPMFKRPKTVLGLDRAVIETGRVNTKR